MLSSNSGNDGSPFGTPSPVNLNSASVADRSPSSPTLLHNHHGSRSASSLQGEFLTHGAKRRRREQVLSGVGGTRRKLNFCDSPPESHKSPPQPPPAAAAYRFDLSDRNITGSPFHVPSASGVKLRCCSTDHSSDHRGQMLHDASANRLFAGSECLLPTGKRFIDWIRIVDRFIIRELRRVKHNTCVNKKGAKRERRIRILMSMR
ncbi:unnamed protein product [Linum trigynum]|uniref:Uncharacterized protein n=1 Tax=Linum trigynum TaxID=586398 RepID=A0AAV2GUM1_9ROSI